MAKRKTTRKPPKGFRTWKAYMASIRPNPAKKGGTKVATKRRAKRATSRRRSSARKRTTRRRTYRRNPKLDPVRTLIDGGTHAAFAVAGKAGARILPELIPGLPRTGAMGIAVDAGVALALGLAADMFLPRASADYVVAGALMAPIERIVAGAGIPYVSAALSAYPQPIALSAYPGPGRRIVRRNLAELPTPGLNRRAGMAAYPAAFASQIGA